MRMGGLQARRSLSKGGGIVGGKMLSEQWKKSLLEGKQRFIDIINKMTCININRR